MTPEPGTEAGRELLRQLGSRFSTVVTSSAVPSILAIEAEARAAVLAEVDGFTFPWADYIEPGVDDALLELAAYLRRDTLSDGGPTDG